MRTETLPIVTRQITLLGSVVGLPIVVTTALVLAYPFGHAVTPADVRLATALALLCVLLVGALLAAILMRRSISLDADCLTIRHSFYTARFRKDCLQSVTVTRFEHADQLGITIKRNGVAAFNFFSGWFYADRGQACFCAISTAPVYRLHFAGAAPSPLAAVSCSPEMAEAIRAWLPPAQSG